MGSHTANRVGDLLDSFTELMEVLNSSDIVIMPLNSHVWVDFLQSVGCCLHLAEASLVWLEEQPVHVGQLHLVIVKEDQLEQKCIIF